MLKKSSAVLFASVLAASAVVPAAVSVYAAEATVVSHYVIQKSGKLYVLDAAAYKEMKAAGVHQSGVLAGTSIAYVKSEDGKIYKLSDFNEAKASKANGTMKDALAILQQAGAAQTNLSIGEVVTSSNGSISLTEPGTSNPAPVEGDLEVIGIE